jgi:cell division septation protein DedD
MLFDRFSFRERDSGMSEEESGVADLPVEARSYSFTLDTRQMVLLIAGYCFLCVLVFALGLIVGRATGSTEPVAETAGSAPVVAHEAATKPRADLSTSGRIPLLPAAEPKPQTLQEPAFTFSPTRPESAVTTTGDTSVAEAPPRFKPMPPPEAVRSSDPPAPTAKVEEKRDTEPRRLAVATESKPKAPPITRASLSQGGDYTIQVSSFQSMEQASDLKGRLSKKGYSAYVQSVTLVDKGTWHRVRVGNYRDKEGAERVAGDLRSRESLPATVMKR